MQRKTIVVLGMHRSGTSAVARMLNLLGCDLPNTLMPEAPSNPKGHWESSAIMALNDAVLHSAGSNWDDWQEYNPAWYDSPVVDDFMQRASTVLNEEFGTSPLFVLKDPRNCRLTRFWFDVLDRAEVSPLVVVPLRNPLEVVDSLVARDGMHRDLAMLLWLRHVLDAEHGSRERRRVFLTYENLLEDWVGEAERMQDILGIAWPRFSSLTAMEMEAFLDRDSRHHIRSEKSVQSNLTVSKWVRDTDAILRRWATSEENPDDHAALDDIRQQLNVAGPAFAKLTYDVSSERHQNRELRALLQAREGELTQITAEIAQLRDAQLASEGQGSEDIQSLEAQLENARLELEAEKSKLASDLASLRDHANAVEADLRTTRADKEADAAALSAAQGDIETLRQELSDHRHQLGDVQSTLRQREEEIAQTLASLDDKHHQLAQAEAGRMAAEGQLEVVEAKLQDANAWVFTLAGERKKSEDQVALLQSRLATAEKSLSETSARLADVQNRYLSPAEKSLLLNRIEDSEILIEGFRAQNEEAKRNLEAAQSEVVALSRLLQQRQAELNDDASVKAQMALRENELTALAEDFRLQTEDAKQRLAVAQSEVVALSRLLQQRQAESTDGASVKAQMALRENELTALAEGFRLQKEEAQQSLETAQSEVVALSKLLQQRQAEVTDVGSSKEVRHLSTQLKAKEAAADQSSRHAKWLQEVNAVVTGYPNWWAFAPKKMREKWQNGRLLRRGLFDADAYLVRYPDVLSSGIDPLRHYIIHGINEKRTF